MIFNRKSQFYSLDKLYKSDDNNAVILYSTIDSDLHDFLKEFLKDKDFFYYKAALVSKDEQKRGFSISSSIVPIEWGDCKINIIDTPGYFDFVGEVEEAVSAAGAAIIVVDGKSGVQVGTQKAWELCDKYKLDFHHMMLCK